MSGLNNKRYLDGDGLLKFWEICCANFPHKDGRGATGDWNINIKGNAATAGVADEAIKLKAARKITIAGAVTGKADFDGSENITISTGVNHTHNTLVSSTTDASNLSETPHAMRFDSCIANTNIDWATGYNNAILTIGRYKNAKYASQLGFSGNGMFHRYFNDKDIDNSTPWYKILDSGNYSTYALPLSGGTLTGNLTAPAFIGALQGNAATASSAAKLTTARKLWGQNFNGEADVAGDLTGVGSITMSGSIAYTTQVIGTKPTGASYASWRIVPYNGSLLIQASGDNGTTKTGKINLEGYEGGKLSQLYVGATNATFSDNVNATKFIGALQGNADSATKVATQITAAAEHYPLLFGSSAAADATMTNSLSSVYKNSTNKVYFIPSEGRLVTPKMSATSFVGNLTGNVTGNLTGVASHVKCVEAATNVDRPILVTNELNELRYSSKVKLNYSTGNVTALTFTGNLVGTAAQTAGTLTLKTPAETKTFNGSADVTFEVTPAKLGLTKAVLYLGKSTTAITDGGTEKPTIDGSVVNTLTAGNIVIDSSDSREYIWNGSKWEKFGLDGEGASGNYKPIQAVVGDPTASGNSTTFIDTIAQDANGKITATKKSVNFGGYKPIQSAVSSPTASGNDISFINTIAQDANGKITATKKTVRSATASQSGVVTTGAQTFAGAKTFNGGIIGNLTGNVTGNADTATTATNLAAAPSLAASGNNITVTAGGKTSGAFTVPYATASSRADYVITRADYSFDSTNLPTSFAQGISCGFVNSNSGFGNFGSVLTMRTYSGGGGALQLYAPYSPTYGGTRLKARFGNYDSNQGNSWTTLKEIAWLEDIPTTYAGSSSAGGPATKVVCSAATSDTNRPILVTNESNGLCYTTKVKLNYSTGIITATNFITTSDRRMKENITEIVDASKSLELGFYEFDYKSGGHSAGHVAQEVREVLPNFVHGKETETEHLSVDYTGLHSVQIKALKDEVDTLKTENKELRERLEKLEALLEKLV